MRWRRLTALLLPLLLVLAPASLHNTRAAGRPAGPTLNAGLNLAIGNGSGAQGFYRTLTEGDWRHDPAGTAHLARGTGRDEVSVAEADGLWLGQALHAVRESPARSLGLFARKFWLHLQGWEIDQLVSLDGWRRAAPVLGLLAMPWSWLIVLCCGAVGWQAARGRDPVTMRLVWILVLLIAAQSLFFVVTRYRLSLVPALCLLAGAGVARWVTAAAGHRRYLPLICALAGVVIVQPWGLQAVRADWRAQAAANEANRWALLAEHEAHPAAVGNALDLYGDALAAGPTRADWWLGLALMRLEAGRPELAEQALRDGAVAHRGDRKLQQALLDLLLAGGRSEEALDQVGTLLKYHPHDPDALHNQVILLAGAGRPAEALAAAERLVERHPADPQGYIDLGVLQARGGRPDLAAETFRRGLEQAPGNEALRQNLQAVTR